MRKSLELKSKAEECYKKASAVLVKIGDKEPTAEERAEVLGFQAEMDKFLSDAKIYEKQEMFEAGRAAGQDVSHLSVEIAEDLEAGKVAKFVPVYPTLGHQLHDIYCAATGKAPKNYTLDEARNKLQAAATGQGEVIDSDGGFALQTDFAAGIEKKMFETGKLLSLVQPVNISSESNRLVERFIDETSRATGSRWGSVRAYWIDEGDSVTASKIKFDLMKTELEKIAALGYASNELLQDFAAMSSLFGVAFTDELVFMTEDAIFEGNGQGKPLGFVTNNPSLITVNKRTNQAAATIISGNLSDIWSRVHTRSKGVGVWLYNNECNPQLDELALPVGTAALEPRFVAYNNEGLIRIKGRPAIEIEYASALGTVGDISFCDFSQYRFINKGGINQAQSIHVRFVNDETAFRAIYRVGGQPKWKSAITPFKGSATLGPSVTLQTRS